jgi:hypothetical protein
MTKAKATKVKTYKIIKAKVIPILYPEIDLSMIRVAPSWTSTLQNRQDPEAPNYLLGKSASDYRSISWFGDSVSKEVELTDIMKKEYLTLVSAFKFKDEATATHAQTYAVKKAFTSAWATSKIVASQIRAGVLEVPYVYAFAFNNPQARAVLEVDSALPRQIARNLFNFHVANDWNNKSSALSN